MESGGSKAQRGNQNCPGVGIPGQSKWSQKAKGCGCPGPINPVHLPTRPPLSPRGRRKPSATRSDQGTPIRSFQRQRGCVQAGGTWGPVRPGRLEEQTPLAAAVLGKAAPSTQQAFTKCLLNCSATKPTPPRGGGPRLPLRIFSPRFTCR